MNIFADTVNKIGTWSTNWNRVWPESWRGFQRNIESDIYISAAFIHFELRVARSGWVNRIHDMEHNGLRIMTYSPTLISRTPLSGKPLEFEFFLIPLRTPVKSIQKKKLFYPKQNPLELELKNTEKWSSNLWNSNVCQGWTSLIRIFTVYSAYVRLYFHVLSNFGPANLPMKP